jgi:hypothetical protein
MAATVHSASVAAAAWRACQLFAFVDGIELIEEDAAVREVSTTTTSQVPDRLTHQWDSPRHRSKGVTKQRSNPKK